MSTIEISVIIPVYNKFSVFLDVFKALLIQSIKKDIYELIIVDDCSTDGIKEYFQNKLHLKDCTKYNFYQEQVKYFRNETNIGRAKSRNIALNNAKGDLIVFLDSDNIPVDNFLEEHYGFHKSSTDSVAIGNVEFNKEQLNSNFYRFWDSRFPGRRKFSNLESIPFYYPGTANGSVKRKDLEHVGLLNEDFLYYGGEDEEIWYRLCRVNKLKNVFLSEAITEHYDTDLTYESFLKNIEIYGEHAGLISKKLHPEYFTTDIRIGKLEPIDFKSDTIYIIVQKLLIKAITGYPIGSFIEQITRIFEFSKIIPVPKIFYGIATARHYIIGVKNRKAHSQ